MPRYQFQRHAGSAGLASLQQDWQGLQAQCVDRAFYHDWRWYSAVSEYLLDDIIYIAAYREQQLVAVFPLQLQWRKRYGIAHRVLALPLRNQIDLADFIIDHQHCQPALFSALLQFVASQPDMGWDLLVAEPVRGCSAAAKLLVEAGRLEQDYQRNNTYLACESSEALNALSKKHLKNVRRLQRKLEQQHPKIGFSCPAAIAEQGLEAFLTLESEGWKGADGKGTSILLDPALAGFYRRLGELFAEGDDLRTDFIVDDDKPVSGQLALRGGDGWYLLKISYHPDYAAFGPGNILLLNMVEEMASEPAIEQVNLVTGPGWAERWHPSQEPVYTLTHFNRSWRGRLLALLRNAVRTLRPWRDRLQQARQKAAKSPQ